MYVGLGGPHSVKGSSYVKRIFKIGISVHSDMVIITRFVDSL